MSEELMQLPGSVRKSIEAAIERAINPKGMSVHDGKINGLAADKVVYLLRAFDQLFASLQPVQPATKTELNDAFAEGMSCRPASVQRPWVGLTDQEIAQLAATHLFQNVWPHSTFAAIHAIEAKLKEKNT